MGTKILIPIFILSLLCACDFPSTIPDLPDSAFAKLTFRIEGRATDKFDESPVNATVDDDENHVRLTEEWQTIDIQLVPLPGDLE